MEEMTVYDYVGKNMSKIREMAKNGLIGSNIITYYHVTKSFKECKGIPSVMQRYTEVANVHKMKEATVRRIIFEMKKPFRK